MYKPYENTDIRYEGLGEVDSLPVVYPYGERLDLTDAWPGKRTDMANLERNATAFRNEERRRFFRRCANYLVAAIKSARAKARERKAHAAFLRWESPDDAPTGSKNNFINILAGTYGAALYRGQNPAKDYRDD